MTGSIYVVHARGTNQIKIGFTRGNVEARVRCWSTGRPEKCEVVDVRPGSLEQEKKMHSSFAPFRAGNGGGREWYVLNEDLLQRLGLTMELFR